MGKKKKKNKKQEPEEEYMTPADLTPVYISDWMKRIKDVDYPILNDPASWPSITSFNARFYAGSICDRFSPGFESDWWKVIEGTPEPPSAFKEFFDNWSDDD